MPLFFKSTLSLTILTVCLAVTPRTKAAEDTLVSVIAEGLNNPRGLNFGPDGSLYVTEAGTGGDGRCIPGPSLEGLASCVGKSGALTRIKDG